MSATSAMPSKLELLRKDCARLETYRQLSVEEFLANSEFQSDTCYLLFTVCQGALNIGMELLDVEGQPRPSDEAAVFALLGEEEVLSETCVSQLTAMERLCDSLSQQYEEIDPRWVYQTLQVNLDGLNLFVGQVQAHLDR
jgi:uncharacterized protein YutE (UPF0331/DUF86 family)